MNTPTTTKKTAAPFKELPEMNLWSIEAMDPESNVRMIELTFDEYAALMIELARLRGTTAAKLVANADRERREEDRESRREVAAERKARAAQSAT